MSDKPKRRVEIEMDDEGYHVTFIHMSETGDVVRSRLYVSYHLIMQDVSVFLNEARYGPTRI